MELLRGILIILTPLGSVLGNDIEFGITSIKQYGAFPSGHVALAILIYFLIDAKESSKIKSAALVLAIFEIICQILARGHYSIDIVGGFFIAYFTYNELSKFENQLTLD
jgi:membrane-associated phospholipid phosphatase